MRARAAIAAAGTAALLTSAPAAADAATIAPVDPSAPATTAPATSPVRDRVIARRPARARASVSVGSTHAYRTADGATVEVALSQSFADDETNRAAAQSFVDFLASRVHGAELGKLRMFIGTATEVNDACGGEQGVAACYVGDERRMYVPSTDPGGGSPFTREYVMTHEYGHHIAAFRRNDPFSAINWGPKYWASYKLVCAGVFGGRYFPGNQGAHYLDDPGEGWADSYAHLHYPSVPFQFNRGFAPDAGAFAAIRRDVLTPWNGPTARTVRRTLSGRRRVTSITSRLTLDGTVALALSGPRRANYDLQVVENGRVVDQTHAAGSRDRVTGTVCRGNPGAASITFRVRRRSGSGPFSLRISTAG
ncbi:MAG TPA: hypothetical protein VGN71_00650 [Solirubrobacteraceae bacterium]|nr:hypothetical protein [Solirubrobacteraceae bacterium]